MFKCLILKEKSKSVQETDIEIKSFKHQNWILRVQSQKHGSVKEAE